MNRAGFLDSFMLEIDAAERPNGWPGHRTGDEAALLAPRGAAKRLHTGVRPTKGHPWNHQDFRRRGGTAGRAS